MKMLTPNNDSAPACDRSAMLIAARGEKKIAQRQTQRRDERKGPARAMHVLRRAAARPLLGG